MHAVKIKPQYECIPQELKDRNQWVGWHTEIRNGKSTKVPINARTGHYASCDDPTTWDTFESASHAYNSRDDLDGVGYVFSADDPYTGIDLDKCRHPETGIVEPWALETVEQINSYTEVSPSGCGLHILVRGALPEGARRRGNLEMYDRSRYFTITGQHLERMPTTIQERDAPLKGLHARVFGPAAQKNDQREYTAASSSHLSDLELIERASRAQNGAKFDRLWRGDSSGYDSQSEADLALCLELAFWTGGDVAQIDRLFRQSGLYRDKWDEKHFGDGRTYGQATIEKAMQGTREYYHGGDRVLHRQQKDTGVGGKVVGLDGRGKIHPAFHMDGKGVIIGRVTEVGEYQLVTSERMVYAPADVKDFLAFSPRPYPDLAGRWRDEDVLRFLGGETTPTVPEVIALMIHALERTMEFQRPGQQQLVATWTVGSYFFPLFLTFPRLNLQGERESGKSKLMELLRATAFNALLMVNPTPAVLYRLVQEFQATLLLDEMEGLSKEDAQVVLAIINSGYKVGGSVPRCEGEKKKQVESFRVYAPIALAAIRGVNATTEDRCIPLVLQRGTNPARINAEVDPADEIFAQIRAGCYRLLLMNWKKVQDTYRNITLPPWLNGRARELWKPILTIAEVADCENGLAIKPDLLALAREHVADRDPVSAEGEALLAVLSEHLAAEARAIIRPRDLADTLKVRLGWRDAPTPQQVGAWLRRFGFRRTGKDRDGAKYEIGADQLEQVTKRYTPDCIVTSSSSHAN